jgi:hypothetical protein
MKSKYTSIALICVAALMTLAVCGSVFAAPRAPLQVDWAALDASQRIPGGPLQPRGSRV